MNNNKNKICRREDGTIEYNGKIIRRLENGILEYDGRLVHRVDRYKMNGKHRLKFTFISSNDVYEQGIILALANFNGDIFWEGKKYDIPKGRFPTLDLFEKNFGKEFVLEIVLRKGEILICNGSIVEKIVRYWEGECGMFIDEISPNKKRYQCNDFSKDFDFDDLTFEIEILD